MKSNYLFPTVYKKIGWVLFVPFAIIGIIFLADSSLLPEIKWNPIVLYTGSQLTDHGQVPGEFFKTINDDMKEEIIVCGLAIALSLIAFSREKDEDELVEHLRAKSLVWSLKANVVLLIVATFILYSDYYVTFAWIYMFSVFLLFIIRFEIELYRFRHSNHEE